MSTHPEPHAYERNESEAHTLDRNWNEILQELRVTQTGTQILTGFLLTIAFQPRFAELDAIEHNLYLALVALAAATTAMGLAPVAFHRMLFKQRAKDRLVIIANRLLKLTLFGVAIVLIGTTVLVFDVVAGRGIAFVLGGIMLVLLAGVWVGLPLARRRQTPDDAG